MESSSSSESFATFRNVIAAANEAEIYNRIRALEGLQYYNLPPQNNPGEYESIVRDHFDQAVSVNHYREIYDQEYFELLVLEPKGVLQDKLKNLMLEEPNLGRILEFSPYNNIREGAFDFIQDKVEPVSDLQHAFQRNILDGTLNSFIQDIDRRVPSGLE